MPAADKGCRSWHVWVGTAFPKRPNPLWTRVHLEVWILVHWVPSGKKTTEPKLNLFCCKLPIRLNFIIDS